MKTLIYVLLSLSLSILVVACATVGTQFDETKVQQIEKGKTTQAQVLELLGKPFGKGVDSQGKTQWKYQYLRSIAYGRTTHKMLIIMFDKNNVVEDFHYQESGK